MTFVVFDTVKDSAVFIFKGQAVSLLGLLRPLMITAPQSFETTTH